MPKCAVEKSAENAGEGNPGEKIGVAERSRGFLKQRRNKTDIERKEREREKCEAERNDAVEVGFRGIVDRVIPRGEEKRSRRCRRRPTRRRNLRLQAR